MNKLTIKEIAKKTNISAYAVRQNILQLLTLLPVKDRVAVMEDLVYCREHKNRSKNLA